MAAAHLWQKAQRFDMDVTTLPRSPGSRHRRKRVGRGIGSGHGKTATRGQKGQRARTGSRKRPGFEGGRNPLIRSMPKRGFRRKAKNQLIPAQVFNVEQLNRFKAGEKVTPERLAEVGLIPSSFRTVKVLGEGSLTTRVAVFVHAVSASAKKKIEQAGGTVELIK